VFDSDSVPSDARTDVDSDQWSAVNTLTSLRVPIKSSFMVCEKTSDAQEAFFEVPAKRKGQKSILFGRIESEPVARESSKDDPESPHFSYYGPNACRMMENMRYDLMKKVRLELWLTKTNTAPFFCPKRAGP